MVNEGLIRWNGISSTDVVSAKVLPRKAAQAQEGGAARIFSYGDEGALTEEGCDCLDNPDTRAGCDQPVTQ